MSSPLGLDRNSAWGDVHALITGFGRSGFAAADSLVHLGAAVTVVDQSETDELHEKAQILGLLGADVRLGSDALENLPSGIDLIVTSPGWRPDTTMLAEATVPVWSEVELAWRLRGSEKWLVVTGTNGKTSTVQMLDAILAADGVRSTAVGNVGRPVVEAVMDPQPYDVLAIELSSFQLHWTDTMAADSAAVLNVAPDHLDWHGSLSEYTNAKARAYARCRTACVYNVHDPVTEDLVRAADVVEGCRAIGFTTGIPAPGMVGVVDDVIADRAFVAERQTSAAPLASLADLPFTAPHQLSNALAATTLARAFGVSAQAVGKGLGNFIPDEHRVNEIAQHNGLVWIDDSKATNTHAAEASLNSRQSVVWIAGGLAKDAQFDDLVRRTSERIRAVVLIGRDREVINEAFSRHAPQIPRVVIDSRHTDLMDDVVAAAADLAQPGDTVLLAPGCASMDQFDNYAARGNAFAQSVHRFLAR